MCECIMLDYYEAFIPLYYAYCLTLSDYVRHFDDWYGGSGYIEIFKIIFKTLWIYIIYSTHTHTHTHLFIV